jgi:hypothetical protein
MADPNTCTRCGAALRAHSAIAAELIFLGAINRIVQLPPEQEVVSWLTSYAMALGFELKALCNWCAFESHALSRPRPVCHCGRRKHGRRGQIPTCDGCEQTVGSCRCAPLSWMPACDCGRPVYPDEIGGLRCLKCNSFCEACKCTPLVEVANG